LLRALFLGRAFWLRQLLTIRPNHRRIFKWQRLYFIFGSSVCVSSALVGLSDVFLSGANRKRESGNQFLVIKNASKN